MHWWMDGWMVDRLTKLFTDNSGTNGTITSFSLLGSSSFSLVNHDVLLSFIHFDFIKGPSRKALLEIVPNEHSDIFSGTAGRET